MNGTLYGIGVGPGAPDLLTLRAVNILGKVDVILAAASPRNDYSAAYEIARPHLRPDVETLRLGFPMTRDRDLMQQAWEKAADTTLRILARGRNAAFLTIGDPLIYSTFSYLMRTLLAKAPAADIIIVPGISSIQAACAKTATALCEGGETVRILPGINSQQELENEIAGADTAVILKAYRNFPAIVRALRKNGRDKSCLLASLVEREGERLQTGLDGIDAPPYMSLVISRKPNGEPR